jgi:hypothetical protein
VEFGGEHAVGANGAVDVGSVIENLRHPHAGINQNAISEKLRFDFFLLFHFCKVYRQGVPVLLPV